jgi:cephalosporin-C deacetylase-like acetyl esterase
MSYFDTKNLATRISCAVLASSGLQDDVCPPRLNVVPFNNLATPADMKEYIFVPEMGHSYPSNWWSKMNALFSKYF